MEGAERFLLCQKFLRKSKEFHRAEDPAPEKEIAPNAAEGKEEAFL